MIFDTGARNFHEHLLCPTRHQKSSEIPLDRIESALFDFLSLESLKIRAREIELKEKKI